METTSVLFEPLFTAREAAQVWGVCRQTVTLWVHAGYVVPARKLPGAHGSYLFTGTEVERVAAAPRLKRGRPFTKNHGEDRGRVRKTVAA